ncbi:MAG: MFS transporter [Kineosporiaceae bacterium]
MARAGTAETATTWGDLRSAAGSRSYRRLLATRLSSQTGDGLFQAGLASLVLFNPEQQATPLLVAGALTVAVLPFTVVGPLAGVFLDRWHRQRVLVVANVVRAVLALGCVGVVAAGGGSLAGAWPAVLYALVLGALTVNRFLLAGLGASLPHTVPAGVLVTANAVTPTAGTGAFAAGLAVGGAGRAAAGSGVATDAALLTGALVLWLLAAGLAGRLPAASLGPAERTAASVRTAAVAAVAGLREGGLHLWRRPAPRDGLAAMAAHRFAFGVLTITLVVLARGYLTDDVDEAVGVLVVTGAAAGVGAVLAAAVSPGATRAVGGVGRWLTACLGLAGAAVAVLALVPPSVGLLTGLAGAVAFAGQGVKISVDTLVQTGVDDAVRGRAFTFYDVTYNAAFVAAAALAAVVVPSDGYSPWLFAGLAGWYALVAAWSLRSRRRAAVPGRTPAEPVPKR